MFARRIMPLALSAVITAASGCSVTIGPEEAVIPRSAHPAILQLGQVSETFTGTWAPAARAQGAGFRKDLIRELRQSNASSLFSSAPTGLNMRISLTADHADDGPGLVGLGCLSMVTLGIIPLRFQTEWNVQCDVAIYLTDGTFVAKYPLQEVGTYKIWAFPLTMFALFGAGIRGPDDGAQMARQTSHNLAARIVKAVDADHARLAKFAAAAAQAIDQRAITARLGTATCWVLYGQVRTRTGQQRYVLKLYSRRPRTSTAPDITLAIGQRRTVARADSAWQWFDPKNIVFYAERKLWYPEWTTQRPYDALASVEFKERPVPAKELFRDGSLSGLSADAWNSFLISWKNRELAGLLREASTRELRDHMDNIEHMILRANEAAEREKDKAQALIRKGSSGAESHTQAARKYQSRIVILKPVLTAIKTEVANRQR
jgi:hypothetical protein